MAGPDPVVVALRRGKVILVDEDRAARLA